MGRKAEGAGGGQAWAMSAGAAGRYRGAGEGSGEGLDEKPRSVYEVVTRQMLEQMRADVSEVKSRVNALLWLVVGAMLVELLLKAVK